MKASAVAEPDSTDALPSSTGMAQVATHSKHDVSRRRFGRARRREFLSGASIHSPGGDMKRSQRYRGEAIRRAQQFLDAHADIFGAINSSDARKKLDASLTKLDAVVDIQLSREREARGELQRQYVLERDLRDRQMMPVSKFARGTLAGVPNFAALTPSAGSRKGAALVDAARAMAVAALPYAKMFVSASFPADFVQQLTDAANTLQGSIDTRRRKLADRVGATAGVEAAVKEARSAALVIEGAVGRIVQRGTPIFHEWKSVRRVVNIAVRSRQEDSSIAGKITPAESEGKAAAA
jgi:hypothetical protein